MKYIFRGTSMSLAHIAARVGMSPSTLRHRVIVQGLSLDEAVSPVPKRARNEPRLFEFQGGKHTAREIASALGVNVSSVYRRLEAGAFASDPAGSVKITYLGETLCVAAWARRLGVTSYHIYSRLANGWDPERALATPIKEPVKLTFQGKTLTIAGWAKETGIPAATLRERIVQYQWPLPRALTEPAVTAQARTQTRVTNRRLIARMSSAFAQECPGGGRELSPRTRDRRR